MSHQMKIWKDMCPVNINEKLFPTLALYNRTIIIIIIIIIIIVFSISFIVNKIIMCAKMTTLA